MTISEICRYLEDNNFERDGQSLTHGFKHKKYDIIFHFHAEMAIRTYKCGWKDSPLLMKLYSSDKNFQTKYSNNFKTCKSHIHQILKSIERDSKINNLIK